MASKIFTSLVFIDFNSGKRVSLTMNLSIPFCSISFWNDSMVFTFTVIEVVLEKIVQIFGNTLFLMVGKSMDCRMISTLSKVLLWIWKLAFKSSVLSKI
ncbi:hypothetical protein WICPIJ_007194 [Wickerhamomyces pijperi]|uniref:Uncharacterized protein n=1 Tax=Wickerhamomyces pijperi TaxID=599730 RepID=A0A9P8Q283_WICPI|nr:hypothetical protein WICPIJ_007194 [Wickerhamomyces pijperi]